MRHLTIIDEAVACPYRQSHEGGGEKVCIRVSGKRVVYSQVRQHCLVLPLFIHTAKCSCNTCAKLGCVYLKKKNCPHKSKRFRSVGGKITSDFKF